MKRLKSDFEGSENTFLKISSDFVIRISDILFIERNKSKASVCTINNNYETNYSLNTLKQKLPSGFYRTGRSYIINREQINNIDIQNKLLLFPHGHSCPFGRFDYKKFLNNI